MITVVDASAALEVALSRQGAGALREHLAAADWVIAPDLFVSEVTNAFWKYHRFADVPREVCERGLEGALALPDDLISTKDFARESLALACLTGQPAYDMFYLVLARRESAVLLTLDGSLKDTARRHNVATT